MVSEPNKKTIHGLDGNGLRKTYAFSMKDKMAAGALGRDKNYVWGSPLGKRKLSHICIMWEIRGLSTTEGLSIVILTIVHTLKQETGFLSIIVISYLVCVCVCVCVCVLFCFLFCQDPVLFSGTLRFNLDLFVVVVVVVVVVCFLSGPRVVLWNPSF